jgi:hypothetical protein
MNVNTRSRIRLGIILLAVIVGSAPAARAQEEARKSDPSRLRVRDFNARDIKRNYGFSCSGAVVASDVLPPGPFAQVGQVYCDGIETCTGSAMASFAGLVLPADLIGTYTVNANGTGFVLYDLTVGGQPAGQLPIHFVITDEGRGIKGLPVTSGFAITCDLQAQRERD